MKETNKKITTCFFIRRSHYFYALGIYFLESSFLPSGSKCPDKQEEEW